MVGFRAVWHYSKCTIAGMAVAGCNNRCDDKQSDTNKLYLIHQETTPFGIDYDLYDSEKLPELIWIMGVMALLT